MDDKLAFLSEQPESVEETPTPEAQTSPDTAAPTQDAPPPPAADPPQAGREERPRGPDGKFAPKAAAEPGHVPISAMLDEREKRQALERRLAEMEAKASPPPPPEATEQLAAALYAQNLRASRKFAEREYGKETIAKVHDWVAAKCDADPHFNAQARSSDDPYEFAYQAYQREQVLSKVTPSDLEAFEAWKKAQAEAQAATPQQPASTPPPRSLATAPGNGAAGQVHVPTGPRAAFDAIFSG